MIIKIREWQPSKQLCGAHFRYYVTKLPSRHRRNRTASANNMDFCSRFELILRVNCIKHVRELTFTAVNSGFTLKQLADSPKLHLPFNIKSFHKLHTQKHSLHIQGVAEAK